MSYSKDVGAFLKCAVRNGSRVAAHILHDLKTRPEDEWFFEEPKFKLLLKRITRIKDGTKEYYRPTTLPVSQQELDFYSYLLRSSEKGITIEIVSGSDLATVFPGNQEYVKFLRAVGCRGIVAKENGVIAGYAIMWPIDVYFYDCKAEKPAISGWFMDKACGKYEHLLHSYGKIHCLVVTMGGGFFDYQNLPIPEGLKEYHQYTFAVPIKPQQFIGLLPPSELGTLYTENGRYWLGHSNLGWLGGHILVRVGDDSHCRRCGSRLDIKYHLCSRCRKLHIKKTVFGQFMDSTSEDDLTIAMRNAIMFVQKNQQNKEENND